MRIDFDDGLIKAAPAGDVAYHLFSYGSRAVVAAPRHPRRILRAGVACCAADTRRRALYRDCLLLAVGGRFDRFIARRVPLPLSPGVTETITDWLAARHPTTDVADLAFVVRWPPQPDRGRVYVHIINALGAQVCFVKVSLDDDNDRMLLREAAALTNLQELPRRHFEPPALLAVRQADDHVQLILEPLPQPSRREHTSARFPAQAVNEYAAAQVEVNSAALDTLDWFRDGFSVAVHTPPSFRAALVADGRGWTLCRAHGDLSAHNMTTAHGRLWIFDWEESSPDAPRLADRVGFALSRLSPRILRRPERWRHIVAEGAPELTSLPRRDLMLALVFRAGRRIHDATAIMNHWHLSGGWGHE